MNANEEVTKNFIGADQKNIADSEKAYAHKLNMVQNFSRLMNFLKDLILADRKNSRVNPIRVQFYNLIKSHDNNIKNSHFLFNLINSLNQIEMSKKHADLRKVQETILSFFQFLHRSLPDVFLDQMSSQDFCKPNEEVSQNTNVNVYIFKLLLENISKAKLDQTNADNSLTVSSMTLDVLIQFSKLYLVYFNKNYNNITAQIEPLTVPTINLHLNDMSGQLSITQMINEFLKNIDNLIRQIPQVPPNNMFFDLMIKFFVYSHSLVESLVQLKQLEKLKQIFNWSNKTSNELLIDSISTSDPFSTSVYQHSLTNLDKKIENYMSIPTISAFSKDEQQSLTKKLKFCFNQSKRLIKILNDYDLIKDNVSSSPHHFNSSHTEFDLTFGYKLDINLICFKSDQNQRDFEDYFQNRRVFTLCSSSKDEMKQFNSEWPTEWTNYECNNKNVNLDDIEIQFEDVLDNFHSNLIPNSLLTLPIEGNLISDKEFLNRLIKSIEDEELKHRQAKRPFSELTIEQIVSTQKQFDYEKLNKIKNEQLVNTRTGIRYKAPMRGGHTNSQLNRNLSVNNNNIPALNSSSSAINNGQSNSSNIQQLNINNSIACFGIGNNNSSNMIRNESFRARTLNSSRAPSLHVDEYYRMEKEIQQKNQQQHQQQQQNQQASTENNNNNSNICEDDLQQMDVTSSSLPVNASSPALLSFPRDKIKESSETNTNQNINRVNKSNNIVINSNSSFTNSTTSAFNNNASSQLGIKCINNTLSSQSIAASCSNHNNKIYNSTQNDFQTVNSTGDEEVASKITPKQSLISHSKQPLLEINLQREDSNSSTSSTNSLASSASLTKNTGQATNFPSKSNFLITYLTNSLLLKI